MSLLYELPQILAQGRQEYEQAAAGAFSPCELLNGDRALDRGNLLALGENLAFMKYLYTERGMGGKLNLVYIDPPFFSKANYGAEIKLRSERVEKIPAMKQLAYYDRWNEGLASYLSMLCARFYMIRELLADDGCLWVHLDWHASHYVKVLLDEIFGEKNFVNEIIWNYKSGGTSKKHFAKKHDTLLFYSKTAAYYFRPQREKSYNRGFKPYRFKGVREYKDELGWYTMVNMKDVWQLDMVGRTSAERTGYVTQKPETLLARILESCTREGDLAADFFCGAGTLAAAAEKLGRRFIACDIGRLAVVNSQKRLAAAGAAFTVLREGADDEGDFDADITLSPLEFTDKSLLTVELLSYRPQDLDKIPIDDKNKGVLLEVIRQDPLQLIDYWSIDCYGEDAAQETPHRAEAFFAKGRERVECRYTKIGRGFDRISVRVVDIFGNSTRKKFRVGEQF